MDVNKVRIGDRVKYKGTDGTRTKLTKDAIYRIARFHLQAGARVGFYIEHMDKGDWWLTSRFEHVVTPAPKLTKTMLVDLVRYGIVFGQDVENSFGWTYEDAVEIFENWKSHQKEIA